MAIDITVETLLTLTDAAKRLPNPPHVSTLHRWRMQGVRGIKLETVLIGGRRFTSLEALTRFSERTTAVADGLEPPRRTPAERERAIEQAMEEVRRWRV